MASSLQLWPPSSSCSGIHSQTWHNGASLAWLNSSSALSVDPQLGQGGLAVGVASPSTSTSSSSTWGSDAGMSGPSSRLMGSVWRLWTSFNGGLDSLGDAKHPSSISSIAQKRNSLCVFRSFRARVTFRLIFMYVCASSLPTPCKVLVQPRATSLHGRTWDLAFVEQPPGSRRACSKCCPTAALQPARLCSRLISTARSVRWVCFGPADCRRIHVPHSFHHREAGGFCPVGFARFLGRSDTGPLARSAFSTPDSGLTLASRWTGDRE